MIIMWNRACYRSQDGIIGGLGQATTWLSSASLVGSIKRKLMLLGVG